MITPLERVQNLLNDLRMAQVDFDAVFTGKNDLTPLEAVELFLLEQQRMRVEKQNALRRRRAALPAEKTLQTFDFGFQKSVSKEQKLKIENIHFAWDLMKNSKRIVRGLNLWKRYGKKVRGSWGMVYVLTNFNTTMTENLFRIYKLRDMGFDPYVMVYDKPNAPAEIRRLQRWCNNKFIFKSCKRFEDYDPKKG